MLWQFLLPCLCNPPLHSVANMSELQVISMRVNQVSDRVALRYCEQSAPSGSSELAFQSHLQIDPDWLSSHIQSRSGMQVCLP